MKNWTNPPPPIKKRNPTSISQNQWKSFEEKHQKSEMTIIFQRWFLHAWRKIVHNIFPFSFQWHWMGGGGEVGEKVHETIGNMTIFQPVANVCMWFRGGNVKVTIEGDTVLVEIVNRPRKDTPWCYFFVLISETWIIQFKKEEKEKKKEFGVKSEKIAGRKVFQVADDWQILPQPAEIGQNRRRTGRFPSCMSGDD